MTSTSVRREEDESPLKKVGTFTVLMRGLMKVQGGIHGPCVCTCLVFGGPRELDVPGREETVLNDSPGEKIMDNIRDGVYEQK